MFVSSIVFCAEVQSDIEYGKAGDVKLLLDACVPDGDGPFPIAIIVHGGGWSGGDNARDMSLLFKPLADSWDGRQKCALQPVGEFPKEIEGTRRAARNHNHRKGRTRHEELGKTRYKL
jgi:hypothetical protein